MRIWIYICVNVCTCFAAQKCVCMHPCVCIRLYVFVCVCMRACVYIFMCMHTHAHTPHSRTGASESSSLRMYKQVYTRSPTLIRIYLQLLCERTILPVRARTAENHGVYCLYLSCFLLLCPLEVCGLFARLFARIMVFFALFLFCFLLLFFVSFFR